jgi:uncharacterized protein (TIGR02145 family)
MKQKKILLVAMTLLCLRLITLHAQTVTDADGNVYITLSIGDQIWMQENLKTTTLNDGTTIPIVTEYNKWGKMEKPAYCWFQNNIQNKEVYGALYNFYTVNTKKLCPKGWHVPSKDEWTTLIEYLGGEEKAGAIMKEKGTSHWKNILKYGTDEYDFTAIPGGMRFGRGNFPLFGNSYAIWWTSTMFNEVDAWCFGLFDESNHSFKGHDDIHNGYSIRCIKD